MSSRRYSCPGTNMEGPRSRTDGRSFDRPRGSRGDRSDRENRTQAGQRRGRTAPSPPPRATASSPRARPRCSLARRPRALGEAERDVPGGPANPSSAGGDQLVRRTRAGDGADLPVGERAPSRTLRCRETAGVGDPFGQEAADRIGTRPSAPDERGGPRSGKTDHPARAATVDRAPPWVRYRPPAVPGGGTPARSGKPAGAAFRRGRPRPRPRWTPKARRHAPAASTRSVGVRGDSDARAREDSPVASGDSTDGDTAVLACGRCVTPTGSGRSVGWSEARALRRPTARAMVGCRRVGHAGSCGATRRLTRCAGRWFLDRNAIRPPQGSGRPLGPPGEHRSSADAPSRRPAAHPRSPPGRPEHRTATSRAGTSLARSGLPGTRAAPGSRRLR